MYYHVHGDSCRMHDVIDIFFNGNSHSLLPHLKERAVFFDEFFHLYLLNFPAYKHIRYVLSIPTKRNLGKLHLRFPLQQFGETSCK